MFSAWRERHLVTGPDLPGKERTGYHRAEAGNRENPVHGEAERAVRGFLLYLVSQRRETRLQIFKPVTGP